MLQDLANLVMVLVGNGRGGMEGGGKQVLQDLTSMVLVLITIWG